MSLREYIDQHRAIGEVEDFTAAVETAPVLCAGVYARMQDEAPSILLFHKCARTDFKIAANLFAAPGRLERLLTYDGKSLLSRAEGLPPSIESWSDFSAYLQKNYTCSSEDDNCAGDDRGRVSSLYALPQIRHWSGDTRAYFSLPTVFTRAYSSDVVNAGVYRLSPLDSKTLTINWRPGSRAYHAWREYAQRGERMPLTVALGADPALIFASMVPLSASGSETALWNFIRGGGQCLQLNAEGLPVPQDAEIILEGYVDPEHLHEEGSFANHTGFYTSSAACPVMHVNSIRARHDAIMPMTVVGPPPTESAMLGCVIWELLSVYIKREWSCVVSVFCPLETAHLAAVILQVRAPADINEWREQKSSFLQHSILKRLHTLILVDEDTDISNLNMLYWHCMNLEDASYTVTQSGMRVIDGVAWRYQGRRRVFVPI